MLSSDERMNIEINDENSFPGSARSSGIKKVPFGNAHNQNQLQGTALEVIMENGPKAFKESSSQSKRRMFGDLTNHHKYTQTRSVCQKPKYQKHGPRQSAITEFAVVKHKTAIPEKSEKDATNDSGCCIPEPIELKFDLIEKENLPIISEDVEMRDLQYSWTNMLGKRFNEIHLVDLNEEPLTKRRKKNDEKVKNRCGNGDDNDDDDDDEQNFNKENEPPIYSEVFDSGFSEPRYSLNIVTRPTILTAGFACIKNDVLEDLLRSMELSDFIQKYVLVDCRYPFEYEGGHIKGATNIFDPAKLEDTFFPDCLIKFRAITRKIPIFYCEYSTVRGPMFASHLRKSDRVRNYDRYPYVHYQEIYVLEGGYNAFYNVENARLKDLCEPVGYVPMNSLEHSGNLKEFRAHCRRIGIGFETGMFQTAVIRKKNDFCRSNSFPPYFESPTASAFASVMSPEKLRPDCTVVPMLVNPRTPTGCKRIS